MSCCDTNNKSNMAGAVFETPATENTTGTGFEVKGNEVLNYSFSFVDNVLDPAKEDLANYYTKWGRVLIIMDKIVHGIYGDKVRAYFAAYKITPVFHVFNGGEVHKDMDTMLGMVDAMDDFGLVSIHAAFTTYLRRMLTKSLFPYTRSARSRFLSSAVVSPATLLATPARRTVATLTTFASARRSSR